MRRHSPIVAMLIAAVTVLVLVCMPAASSLAQDPLSIAQAGTGPAVATPEQAEAGSGMMMAPTEALEGMVSIRNRLWLTLRAAPAAPAAIVATLENPAQGAQAGWIWRALLLTCLSLAVGALAAFGIERWTAQLRQAAHPAPGADKAARIAFVLTRISTSLLAILALFFAGLTTTVVLSPEATPARWTSLMTLATLSAFLLQRDFVVGILSQHTPRARLTGLDDAQTRRLSGPFLAVLAVSCAIFGLSGWLSGLGLQESYVDLLQVIASGVLCAGMIVCVIVRREMVARLIAGPSRRPSRWRATLAATWHLFAIAYLLAATAFSIAHVLMSSTYQPGPILGPVAAALAGALVLGVAALVIERQFRRRRAPGESRDGDPVGSDIQAGSTHPTERDIVTAADHVSPWPERWRRYWLHVATIFAALVAAAVLLAVWGLLGRGETARHWLAVTSVLFATYVLYSAVRVWIDGQIADEAGHVPEAGDHEAREIGKGSSRLATLLPLLRKILIAAIVCIGAMLLLAGLGVSVAPLFAGAGVVGLAIGFGAQTLIRDIFSGAFFLLDDAFRRGEYIDVGSAKGTVEKISVRSFQLRHHNGPLNTIPFGEIKQLTNYSRDWVIMKLNLRLVYGTDIERVRKLIKKLGAELAQDPEVGPLFLEPLKSQGVIQMEDSAMILRVKFMARPGDQFILRRVVFTRIHMLFDAEHIAFANRQVTVRVETVNGRAGEEELDPATRAALGSVESILDAEMPTKPR